MLFAETMAIAQLLRDCVHGQTLTSVLGNMLNNARIVQPDLLMRLHLTQTMCLANVQIKVIIDIIPDVVPTLVQSDR